MKIVSKYLEFKNTIEEVEGVGKAVFSRDSNNLIWHEVATKINNLLNIRTSVFVMILNNQIVQIEKDPSLISPLENSSVIEIDEENNLSVGKYVAISKDILINIDEPSNYIHPKFNLTTSSWIETASDDEITEYIGKNVTKLLYEVLSIGCEVTVKGEKHQQSLSDEKRKALNERISGFKLAEELGSPITHVAWPFKDDGTDTVVMTTDKFKQMSLYCLNYGDKCYIAAELLKAKRNINTTLEDFYSELEYIDEINLENL